LEKLSIILSIVASIGTLVSLYLNQNMKKELGILKQQINGNRNIQSKGDNVINNTGNSNTFKR